MELENHASRAIVRAVAAVWLALLVALVALAVALPHEGRVTVPYSQFLVAVQRGTMRAVTLERDSVRWTTPNDHEFVSRLPDRNKAYLRLLRARGVAITVVSRHDPMDSWLLRVAPTAAVAVLVVLALHRKGPS